VGSNPTRDMNVRICSLFVLSCIGSGLTTGLIALRGVLPTVSIFYCSGLLWEQARRLNTKGRRSRTFYVCWILESDAIMLLVLILNMTFVRFQFRVCRTVLRVVTFE
jgi:hypothetical protein